jgi:L-serine dehydratase
MAAAACVELMGGTPDMCAQAAALAIKFLMGLICDPVCGLVEVPCVKRNASGATNALTAADMALAGIKSAIPCDEVITAMGLVGKAIPQELRETSLGGLAVTAPAKAYGQAGGNR